MDGSQKETQVLVAIIVVLLVTVGFGLYDLFHQSS